MTVSPITQYHSGVLPEALDHDVSVRDRSGVRNDTE